MKELWFYAAAGLTSGGAYALTSLGIVLIYRGSGVLNFAQGAIGMAGAFVFWELRYAHGWSVAPALFLGVCAGGLLGAVVYTVVLRFLRNAGELPRVIVTLGLLLAIQGAAQLRYGGEVKTVRPVFAGRGFHLWDAVITRDSAAVLVVCLVVAGVAAVVFRWTRFGAVTTALSDNASVAATLGISPHRGALATWTAGGALGALAGSLLLPLTGVSPLGLSLIIAPSMAVALLARFRSIPVALAGGLALGVAEALLVKFHFEPGYIRSLPFGVIVVTLVLAGRGLASPSTGQAKRLPALGSGRPNLAVAAPLAVAVLAGSLLVSGSWATAIVNSAIAALLALSLVVVTGYAGQINLAPFALAGVSALVVAHADHAWHLPFVLLVPLGVAAAAVVGVIIGLPAVRVRGVNLAIATLGLAYAIESAVLGSPSLTGGVDGLRLSKPSLFGLDIAIGVHPQRFAAVAVISVMVSSLMVANTRRGRSGRRYAAVRANERGAAALGVQVANTKLAAFAVSSAIAGLAGALSIYRFNVATFDDFTTTASILALAFVVVGGIGSPVGGIVAGTIAAGGIGTLFFERFLHFDKIASWLPLLTGVVVIDMMLRSPDGMVWQVFRVREKRAARRRRMTSTEPERLVTTEEEPVSLPGTGKSGHPGDEVLTGRGLTVRFGATTAVDGVDLTVKAGRVVGVVGPNGAGKTTLVNVLSGFERPQAGDVRLYGEDVGRLRPAQRARRGLVRTFQQLELFDDLTVTENILAGADDHRPSAYALDLLRPGRPELDSFGQAVAHALNLDGDLDKRVADLPQGKRRLVAIARVVVGRPAVVCLDEPAAGLSTPERRMLTSVIAAMARDLNMGVLLIEHNIDVVAGVCDELIVLDFGRVIARGDTATVLADPMVAVAYLGETPTGDHDELTEVMVP